MIPLPPVAIAGGLGVVVVGLLVALAVGVVAGSTGKRFVYLIAGVVVAVVVGVVVTAVKAPPAAAQPERISTVYSVAVPLAVAFVTGWLCARGSWFTRVVVIVVAVVVLAAFPYTAVATATAAVVPGG